MLAGCGSPSATFEGREVKDLDKTIEQIDQQWAQSRADGAKSNVDEDSRCYAQVTELAMANSAICGPIHYLGEDEQVWESIELAFFPVSDKEITASVSGSFTKAEPLQNTTLFRPDGKKAPEELTVPEPDTEAASPEQAIWNSASYEISDELKVFVPGGTITLNDMKVSERIGNAENRLRAGEGYMFASVSMNELYEPAVPVELYFTTGGKSYPVGAPKAGQVSMALPGDLKDVALEVTADGNTQAVSLADGKLTTTASAYYDGLAVVSETFNEISQKKEDGEAFSSLMLREHQNRRDAYEETQGWAPEGKAWLIVDTEFRSGLGYGTAMHSDYEHTVKVTSATVEGISGEKYTAEAVRIDNSQGSDDGYSSYDASRIVFEVPAGVGDFKVTLNTNASGTQAEFGYYKDESPASLSIDDVVTYDAVFTRMSS